MKFIDFVSIALAGLYYIDLHIAFSHTIGISHNFELYYPYNMTGETGRAGSRNFFKGGIVGTAPIKLN